MRILLTGATGFVGRNILDRLISEGHDVTCFVRDPSKISCEKIIRGDLRDQGTIPDLRNYDAVVNAAGILGSPQHRVSDYEDNNVLSVKNLMMGCNGQVFLHISSAGVYGPVLGADESFPIRPSNDYERSKAAAEHIVNAYPHHVILRPEFLYGPHDMHTLRIFRYVKMGRFHIIGDGQSMLQPTFISDLTEACLKALRQDPIILNIAGPSEIKVSDFVEAIKKLLQVSYHTYRVPVSLARLYAKSRRFHSLGPDIQESTIDFFTRSRTLDCREAKRLLHLKECPLDEGLIKTIRWYKDNGYL